MIYSLLYVHVADELAAHSFWMRTAFTRSISKSMPVDVMAGGLT
jgi:hypothetical protein